MNRPASLNNLATQAAIAFQRGQEALTELGSDVTTCAARTAQLKVDADKADQEVINLTRLEAENRDTHTRLRAQHRADNEAALDAWRNSGKDDFAGQAERFTAQVSQIAWLTERDSYSLNVLRPKLQLAAMRADAAFVLAGADTAFARTAVAAYHRHAGLQKAIEVDGVAQLPESEGKANTFWRQAIALMGRAAEVSAAADALEQKIAMRKELQ